MLSQAIIRANGARRRLSHLPVSVRCSVSAVYLRCGIRVMFIKVSPQNQRPKAVACRGKVSPGAKVALPDARTSADTTVLVWCRKRVAHPRA